MLSEHHLKQLHASLTGRYEVEREIGRGGMATVYLARDLRHARSVALKVLDPELGAILGADRFLSEIRVTANLQHPNLLPLFDSGEADGLLFYVMPCVEGETLRARLDREKQLPVDEAVRLAVAVAGALDYAHRHGVIHRDLKPENILLHDGQPLIADFGIALAVSNAGGQRVTQTGLSLGTPQYMSPEQATGDRTIDARTDIYSLGAVTYEMLTGEPPHEGSTAQAIIARLMTEEPRSIATIRRSVPAHVDDAVHCALEKLPADRFATAAQFAAALQGNSEPVPGAARRTRTQPAAAARHASRRVWMAAAAGVVAGALIAGGGMLRARPAPAAAPSVRFTFDPPPDSKAQQGGTAVALSPDGRTAVFVGSTTTGDQRLYARRLDQLTAHPITGSEGALQPVFSPDGRWLLFIANGKLKKVPLEGGVSIILADYGAINGADWGSRDVIVGGASRGLRGGLVRTSGEGGAMAEFTKPDSLHGVAAHVWPVILDDGKSILFTLYDGKSIQGSRLAATSLDNGTVVPLGISGIAPLGVAEGRLFFVRSDGAIMAAPFDSHAFKVTGGVVPVMDGVLVCGGCNGDAAVRLSRNGSLVALRGASTSRLVIVDRKGAEHVVDQEARTYGLYELPAVSPDGRHAAAAIEENGVEPHRTNIWVSDIATGMRTRLTADGVNVFPTWTADGRSVVYSANPVGAAEIRRQPADASGAAETIAHGVFGALSPDGRTLAVMSYANAGPQIDTVAVGGAGRRGAFARGRYVGAAAVFSPDGKWIAYSSDEAGVFNLFVRPFPGPGQAIQVSEGISALGASSRWSPDGRHLVYLTPTGHEEATIDPSPVFTVRSRKPFFSEKQYALDNRDVKFDLMPDGNHLLILKPSGGAIQVLVVTNWLEELRQRESAKPR